MDWLETLDWRGITVGVVLSLLLSYPLVRWTWRRAWKAAKWLAVLPWRPVRWMLDALDPVKPNMAEVSELNQQAMDDWAREWKADLEKAIIEGLYAEPEPRFTGLEDRFAGLTITATGSNDNATISVETADNPDGPWESVAVFGEHDHKEAPPPEAGTRTDSNGQVWCWDNGGYWSSPAPGGYCDLCGGTICTADDPDYHAKQLGASYQYQPGGHVQKLDPDKMFRGRARRLPKYSERGWIAVRAKERGFYDNTLYRPGDAFWVKKESEMGRWMEPILP